MVAVSAGEISKVRLGLGNGSGETDAIESSENDCSQRLQLEERPLGLRTFFARNHFETLTSKGAGASPLWL